MTPPQTLFLSLSDVVGALQEHIALCGYDRVVLLADKTTERLCLPRLCGLEAEPSLIVEPGEACKELSVAARLWRELTEVGATRRSCLISLGGGAVTDLAGFVASTYKRGIGLVHIPTTILGAVDAAIGGKTAIDVDGVKNIVGTFYPPSLTMVAAELFDSLPKGEILSGYGEILKYALLEGGSLYTEVMNTFPGIPSREVIEACVKHKERVVIEDPKDRGIRMTLNLGHTVAHALEGLYLRRGSTPPPHGVAVAAGLIVALYLSTKLCALDRDTLYKVCRYVRDGFPPVHFVCDDYDHLMALMRQDKKNSANTITYILLEAPGLPVIHRDVSPEMIIEGLDFYRDFVGV